VVKGEEEKEEEEQEPAAKKRKLAESSKSDANLFKRLERSEHRTAASVPRCIIRPRLTSFLCVHVYSSLRKRRAPERFGSGNKATSKSTAKAAARKKK
jgi:hypothetical protein